MPSSSRLFPALALAAASFLLAIPQLRAAALDELIWRGDQTTGRSIMRDIAQSWASQKRGRIVMQPFSTISGLDAVAQGKADLAGSARGKDTTRAEEAELAFTPVALDAAVMITHPSNRVASLNIHQLYEIYFGRITNWKELGGEDRPINLYAIAAPLDGLEYSLRELIFKKGAKRVAAPRLYMNTIALEQAVALDPAGLGLSTLAGVKDNVGVRMIDVEGVTPSTRTVADGSYPLFITLYLVTREDSPRRSAIARLMDFMDTPDMKDLLRRHQLVPFSDVADFPGVHQNRIAFIDEHLRAEREAARTAAADQAAAVQTAEAAAATEASAVAPIPAETGSGKTAGKRGRSAKTAGANAGD